MVRVYGVGHSLSRPKVLDALAFVGAVIALSACSGAPAEPAAGVSTERVESAEAVVQTAAPGGLLTQAQEAGASAEQLAVLEAGEVSFGEYEAAVNRSIACMRAAGIDVVGGQVVDTRGFPEIPYSFAGSGEGRSDEQTVALADACINEHSGFIEGAYQTSPASLEAQDSRFQPFRNGIVDCVCENGQDVEDDAPREQVLLAAALVQESGGPDCLAESGFLP